jgi:isoleucyl-tRNA synthetase
VLDAVRTHEAFVAGEVLATAVEYAAVAGPTGTGSVSDPQGKNTEVKVAVAKQ